MKFIDFRMSVISKQSSRSRFTLVDPKIDNDNDDDNDINKDENDELSILARSLIDDYQNDNNRGIYYYCHCY